MKDTEILKQLVTDTLAEMIDLAQQGKPEEAEIKAAIILNAFDDVTKHDLPEPPVH